MVPSDQIGRLRKIDTGLRSINQRATRRFIDTSRNPVMMGRAYAAIDGHVSGEEGRASLRAALRADGLSDDQIDGIDALYVRCLLDPSL